ncbi:MAG: hypothetical protein ACLQIB_33240 [Isosphaeraceae bacterium]
MAVYVSGTLATLAGGPFATHDAQTGIDGWRTVADHATRDALGASPALRYRQGMAVYCLNTTGSDGVSGLWIANTAAPAGTDADWTQFAGGGLSAIANLDVLANISGGSAVPTATTLTSLIDAAIGTTQGDILYRGSATWSVLAPGTTGQLLASQGASANPHWVTASGSGTVTSVSWTGDGTIFTASADTPVTTSGTLTPASLIAQTAHYVLAGPTSAGPTAPTFRALAAADLPSTGLTINEWVTTPTALSGSSALSFATVSAYVVTLTASTANTLTISNIAVGQCVTVTTLQGSTGGGTITWAGSTIRWSGGTAGQATAGANLGDVFKFYSPSSGVIMGAVAAPNF